MFRKSARVNRAGIGVAFGGLPMFSTYPVKMTQLESLYLSDSISMFMQGSPDALPGQSSPYPTLLLKIGGAVLETEQQKVPAIVHLSLNELWVMREVTKSSVVVGSERVGVSLLMKVYEGIRALAAETDMQSLVSALGEVAEEEPGKSEYSAQLERLKDDHDLELGGINDGGTFDEHSNDESSESDPNRTDHDTATAA